MAEYFISLSLLIAAVLLIRAVFRKRVSPCVIYALWLVVVVRLFIPFSLINIEVDMPVFSIGAESGETEAAETETPTEETAEKTETEADPPFETREPEVVLPVIPESAVPAETSTPSTDVIIPAETETPTEETAEKSETGVSGAEQTETDASGAGIAGGTDPDEPDVPDQSMWARQKPLPPLRLPRKFSEQRRSVPLSITRPSP